MAVDTGAARSCEMSVPFRAGTEGYASYRIPAVTLTHDGTVLAFAEGRVDSSADDGGATLGLPFRPQAGLVAPVVECSVLHLGEPDALLFSGPADPAYRALMTVRTSLDGGITWRPSHTVNGLPAAYSDLVRLDDATVGLLYETGDFSAYSTITFRRIPMEELV